MSRRTSAFEFEIMFVYQRLRATVLVVDANPYAWGLATSVGMLGSHRLEPIQLPCSRAWCTVDLPIWSARRRRLSHALPHLGRFH